MADRLKLHSSGRTEASPAQLHLYQRVANTLRRLLETLTPGLPRRMRNSNQTLDQYLTHLRASEGAGT